MNSSARRFNSKRVIWKGLVLTCGVSVAACAHLDYPTDWAPVQTVQTGCPDLTGTYSNNGFSWNVNGNESPRKEAINLGDILIPGYASSATYLSVLGPKDGQIRLSAWKSKQWLANRNLVENTDFNCKSGWLEISNSFVAGAPPLFFGGSHGTRYLTKAQDGTLIEQHEDKGVMLWLMIPPVMFADNKSWSRFSPYVPSPDEVSGTNYQPSTASCPSGCAYSTAKYPDAWVPKQSVGKGCPDLTGTYSNDGIKLLGIQPSTTILVKLNSFLLTSMNPRAIQLVGIVGPVNGKLNIRVLDANNAVIGERIFVEGTDFTCDDGTLTMGISSLKQSFSRTQDNALIIHESSNHPAETSRFSVH